MVGISKRTPLAEGDKVKYEISIAFVIAAGVLIIVCIILKCINRFTRLDFGE